MSDQVERSANPAIMHLLRGFLLAALALLLLAPGQAFAYNCNRNGCPGYAPCLTCCTWFGKKCTGQQGVACNCAYSATGSCPNTGTGACVRCSRGKGMPCGGKGKNCSRHGCKAPRCSQAICPNYCMLGKSTCQGIFTNPGPCPTSSCGGDPGCSKDCGCKAGGKACSPGNYTQCAATCPRKNRVWRNCPHNDDPKCGCCADCENVNPTYPACGSENSCSTLPCASNNCCFCWM